METVFYDKKKKIAKDGLLEALNVTSMMFLPCVISSEM